MWKVFVLGLLAGWLIEWVIDWLYWRRRPHREELPAASPRRAGKGSERGAEGSKGAEPSIEANQQASTSADTPAGRIGGEVAMGSPGAVSTSSATLSSKAPVYRQQDLEAVDGIDPKAGGLLRDNGIGTFAELAVTPIAELIRITGRTGDPRGPAGPEDWVAQARLAAVQDWARLAAMQAELRSGGGRLGGGA